MPQFLRSGHSFGHDVSQGSVIALMQIPLLSIRQTHLQRSSLVVMQSTYPIIGRSDVVVVVVSVDWDFVVVAIVVAVIVVNVSDAVVPTFTLLLSLI